MSDAHLRRIWFPVNHNGIPLTEAPLSYKDAEEELKEYTFQTGNSGAVLFQDSDDIVWSTQ